MPEFENLPGWATGISRSPTLIGAVSVEEALFRHSMSDTASSSAVGVLN
jgi:hypothetical protein